MDDSKYTFSRGERNGVIFLLLIMLFSILLKNTVVGWFAKNEPLPEIEVQKIAALRQQIAAAKEYSNTKSGNEKNTENSKSYSGNSYKDKQFPTASAANFTIEVNSATAEDYEKLYGIGKVLSVRIVTFRDKLGGFYTVNQLKDVFGVEDSVFQNFKSHLTIKPKSPQKININTATYDELTANPYFFSTVAKQIIGYRTKVKPFATIDDIKNLYFVRDHPEHFEKMRPYVAVN